MRYVQLVILLTALTIVGAGPSLAREKNLKAIKTVVVDPGHGGDNLGALGFNGVYEKQIVLKIALRVQELLAEQTNATAQLTRDGDDTVPLARRIAFANDLQADLFISLHCNSSFSQKPMGVETYILSEKALQEESAKLSRQVVTPRGLYASAADPAAAAVVKEMLQFAAHRDAMGFAEQVQANLVRSMRTTDRGVKELPIVILRGAEMPGVVIEVGFISNPVEARNLSRSKYQLVVAQAIVDAIIRYDSTLSGKRLPGKVAGSTVGK
jgi:N-acetylmuramoyl-L-alanine amidase